MAIPRSTTGRSGSSKPMGYEIRYRWRPRAGAWHCPRRLPDGHGDRAGGVSDHVTVIPVFDEAATIGGLVARAISHGSVIVVDDGSADGSAAAAAAAGADVLRTAGRCGKGAAL